MSTVSGRYDLYDHIAGMGGWFDKNGSPVQFGDKNVRVYYSDFLKDFEAFKKATGGVLHRHIKANKISEWTQEEAAERCPGLKIIEHSEEREDKRGNKHTKISYTYEYYGKEYKTLKELNKKGVYIDCPVHFTTVYELMPFLPHVVTMSFCDDGVQTVYINEDSEVDSAFKTAAEQGRTYKLAEYYRKALADLCMEVSKVLLYKYEDRCCTAKIEGLEEDADGDFVLTLPFDVDYNFPVKYAWKDGHVRPHWASPMVCGDRQVKLSREDVVGNNSRLIGDFESGEVYISYIKKPDGGYPTFLN